MRPGGATATVAKTVTVPGTTPSGLYYVVATIDDANTIVETNEDNNFGRSATQITIGPDIAVLSARTSPGAAQGANASVTYTLANRGTRQSRLAKARYSAIRLSR